MSGKRGKPVSMAEFVRLWNDLSLTQDEIGERLGISRAAVYFRAKKRGLPARGYPDVIQRRDYDADLLRQMWDGRVHSEDIAAHFGFPHNCMGHYRRKLGLKSRGHGGRIEVIRIAQFLADERERMMADGLRKSAAETKQALLDAKLRERECMRQAA
jgi:hypothetical protein